tara:strand:- start:81 stop:467 length:387 start_codon:yes stop_codon:yes gene_type:complete
LSSGICAVDPEKHIKMNETTNELSKLFDKLHFNTIDELFHDLVVGPFPRNAFPVNNVITILHQIRKADKSLRDAILQYTSTVEILKDFPNMVYLKETMEANKRKLSASRNNHTRLREELTTQLHLLCM